jgi:hypothetical protein
LLDEAGESKLREALLEGPPPGGGMWSGPKVARWIAERNGLEKVHVQRGFEYLRKVGEGGYEPPGPEAFQRPGRPGGAGGFQKASR